MELIQPGRHIVKVSDYALTKTAKGDIGVRVKFSNDLTWRGTISANEKATEICLKTLGLLGFDPAGSLADLSRGPSSQLLDTSKDFEIVVSHKEYNGKMYPNVDWVNEVGGGAFKDVLDKAGAAQILAGNPILKATLSKLKSEGAFARKPLAVAPQSEIEIPF